MSLRFGDSTGRTDDSRPGLERLNLKTTNRLTLVAYSTVPTNAVKPEPVELHSTVPTNAVKPEPRSEFHSTVPMNAVKPEPVESDSSDSSNWEDLEAYADSMLVETPKHEAGNEVEWPGTMVAYRASVEAVVIVVDDD